MTKRCSEVLGITIIIEVIKKKVDILCINNWGKVLHHGVKCQIYATKIQFSQSKTSWQ